MKQKIDYRFEAKSNPESDLAIVYMYGDIMDDRPVDWWTGEPIEEDIITPKEVRDLIESIPESNLELHIHSYGGSVFASVSILNYLNSLDKNLHVIIDGVAASGASIIAMAGDKISMPKNTMMMIHRATTFAWGNASDLKEAAALLEKMDESTVIENYRARFTGTDEELTTLVEAETWMSAGEALAYGLCDEVIDLKPEDKADDKPENSKKMNFENVIKMMSAFGNLKIGDKNEEF